MTIRFVGSHSLYPFEGSQFVTLYEQEVENIPPESRNNGKSSRDECS